MLHRTEEVVEGLDLGVSRMKVDEKAELTVSPAYAYKDQVRVHEWLLCSDSNVMGPVAKFDSKSCLFY